METNHELFMASIDMLSEVHKGALNFIAILPGVNRDSNPADRFLRWRRNKLFALAKHNTHISARLSSTDN
jgi:hypothetical protein